MKYHSISFLGSFILSLEILHSPHVLEFMQKNNFLLYISWVISSVKVDIYFLVLMETVRHIWLNKTFAG